ncbi:LTOR3-like protein [Mya arenaria]|uniref:LTOR3-like protein n=1 Tax=Mya arenaria TaxID=6604 RepID=A0ABY7FUC6_MYAAR|nr:ragulator complex protein LAMTOR3-like [Mya arenaria]XP_052782431.1 ragulator complex protein LAMTOR3-like [Mya arenaria]WAQ95192.1 LTOR3-like protein [Mya arenaria]WAR25747.1 LTOR3-like protein [Mya arenaria]
MKVEIGVTMATEELKVYFTRLMKSVEGLMAIVITDRDGVPVFKVATDQAPDQVLKHNFLGTFGLAASQASKLGMSSNKSIVCFYEHYQVVQINKSPLLLTFIASSETSTGLLLDMDNTFTDALDDLGRVVGTT